jgi:hypothetical protein
MRNNIDKETYNWLFKILSFFGILLIFINIMLYFNPTTYTPQTTSFANATLLLLLGVSLWVRVEYLKLYNFNSYKTRRVPMIASAVVAIFSAIYRLF